MKENTQTQQKTPERIFKEYAVDGLDEHNRSFSWLLETTDRLGARIETETDSARWDSMPFNIRLRGKKSGILYRIKVNYRPRLAKLLSRRINEIDLSDGYSPSVILPAFRMMLDFNVYWYDSRKMDWESFCVIPNQSMDSMVWPIDRIVSLMEALSDDLGAALDIGMNTLRKELVEAYPVSWFAGNTNSKVSFDEVSTYVHHLMDLQDAETQEEFEDISNAFNAIDWEVFRMEADR